MPQRLSKLLYVHDGDPGAIGVAIEESRRILQFPVEGSGVFGIAADPTKPVNAKARLVSVKIEMVALNELPAEAQAATQGQTPCILGFAGTEPALLVNRAGIARSNASTSDLRGKIRYSLARIGWDIE